MQLVHGLAYVLRGLARRVKPDALTTLLKVGYRTLSRWYPALRRRRAPRRLEVYVASHCISCIEARRLTTAAAARFPRLDVRTIDIDTAHTEAARPLPRGVVAVPAYVLDGRVISLGNPAPERLFTLITWRRGR